MARHYIIPIFVPHSGCPHDCIFCNQKKITGSDKKVFGKDVRSTLEDYIGTINRNKAKDSENQEVFIELSFFGGSFTGIPIDYQNELLMEAKTAKDNGIIHAIRLSTRPDYIDEGILNNLKKHGVDIIELGVQSMDNEVLAVAERGHTPEDVIFASNSIKNHGFKLGLQMMVGLPKDNFEKDMETANRIIELRPDFVRIYPSLVIRDTELEVMYTKGVYEPLSLEEAVEICKGLYMKFLRNDIPIIRLGLQTTEEISTKGDVVGGPFHPAFRELVESSLLNDMVDYMLSNYFKESKSVNIEISPRDISKLFADKKRYFQSIINKYNSIQIKVRQNSTLNRFDLRVTGPCNEKNMSLYEYINWKNKAGFSFSI